MARMRRRSSRSVRVTPASRHGAGRVLAALAAEHEVDGGEQPVAAQVADDVGASGGPVAAPGPMIVVRSAAPAGAARPVRAGLLPVEAVAVPVGPTVDQRRQDQQLVALAVGDHQVVDQLDRTLGLDHHRGRSPHALDPPAQLVGVRHGGRQAHQADPARQVDDHLLPHGTPVGVLQVVDLVEHHHLEAVEGGRPGVDHVAQDLGGHHHRRRRSVHRVVAGEQADPGRPVAPHQVGVLLVREGLDGGGVEGLPPAVEGPGHGVLGHDRLAGAGGRGHQDRPAGVDRLDGLALEAVEGEAHRHVPEVRRVRPQPWPRPGAGDGRAGSRRGWRSRRRSTSGTSARTC